MAVLQNGPIADSNDALLESMDRPDSKLMMEEAVDYEMVEQDVADYTNFGYAQPEPVGEEETELE